MRKLDSVSKQFALARARAVDLRPYFSAAIYRLVPVATDLIPTLAVDRYWRCYYNPRYIEGQDVLTVATDLFHELGHLLQRHEERCQHNHFEHDFFNIAGDFEINDGLRTQPDLHLADDAIHPKMYEMPTGLIAEEYYQLVMQRREEFQRLIDFNKPGIRDCGSCSGGERRDWELDVPGATARGLEPYEADRVRNVVARDAQEYARRNPGTVPRGIERWAEGILNPKVPWQTVIKSKARQLYAKRAGMSDYSYQQPNRRQEFYGDIVMPALVDPTPSIAVVLDTSGSMDERLLAEALAEVRGITKDLAPDEGVSVFTVDATASAVQKVFDPKQIRLIGGGGTDMGVGIAAAQRLRPKPELVIVLTDGYTPWPDDGPIGMDVVVGIVGATRVLEPETIAFPGSLPSGYRVHPGEIAPPCPPDWATTVLIS